MAESRAVRSDLEWPLMRGTAERGKAQRKVSQTGGHGAHRGVGAEWVGVVEQRRTVGETERSDTTNQDNEKRTVSF